MCNLCHCDYYYCIYVFLFQHNIKDNRLNLINLIKSQCNTIELKFRRLALHSASGFGCSPLPSPLLYTIALLDIGIYLYIALRFPTSVTTK